MSGAAQQRYPRRLCKTVDEAESQKVYCLCLWHSSGCVGSEKSRLRRGTLYSLPNLQSAHFLVDTIVIWTR
jgi:hypothetical protein